MGQPLHSPCLHLYIIVQCRKIPRVIPHRYHVIPVKYLCIIQLYTYPFDRGHWFYRVNVHIQDQKRTTSTPALLSFQGEYVPPIARGQKKVHHIFTQIIPLVIPKAFKPSPLEVSLPLYNHLLIKIEIIMSD